MALTRIDFAAASLAFATIVISYLLNRRKQLKGLRGPHGDSYLLGVEYKLELENLQQAGDLTVKWAEEYGATYKVPGCFGEKILITSDPRAIHYILHQHVVEFPASRDVRQFFELIFGRGVLWAVGEEHRRHRRVLSPAFSINHMKSFVPLIQQHITQLVEKLNLKLQQGNEVLDIIPWFHKVTLDVIGESSFNYNFEALEGKPNELTDALKHFEYVSWGAFFGYRSDLGPHTYNRTVGFSPSPIQAIARAMPRHLPNLMSDFQVRYIPSAREKVSMRYLELSNQKAREMMQTSGLVLGDGYNDDSEKVELSGKESDVLSVLGDISSLSIISILMRNELVRANRAENPRKRLTENEVLSQMSTLIQAGHHTTGYSLSWILYELCRNPADQQRVYEEIKAIRARTSGELSAADYDELGNGWLGLCVKEALRLHPVALQLAREAKHADLVPLELPVESSSGETISEVPVQPGQRIVVDINMYNRLESVWGPDANKWNPSRFDASAPAKPITVGMTDNLLTFSGGSKGCIGWRFALIELHILLAGLLEQFHFSLPSDMEIKCASVGLVVPVVVGKENEGSRLPLVVRRRERD
ncbi:cytochrome p450 [Moniliophthora roreri]|nr:cytochrome p450 [Moniliophthora roreri]